MKIGIVIADFNEEITLRMEKKALEVAEKQKAEVIEKIHVPGAFEIPLALKKLLGNKDIEGVVVLGAVIQGDTYHDVVIVESIARKLLDLSLEHNMPVGFGVIGPRVTWEKAEERAEEYTKRAVEAVAYLIKELKK